MTQRTAHWSVVRHSATTQKVRSKTHKYNNYSIYLWKSIHQGTIYGSSVSEIHC